MLRKLLTLLFVSTTALNFGYAQVIESNSDYQELFDLYVFGDFEKCLKKSLKYTDKDKTRRDAEPYLFASVCYLKIHENPDDFDPEIEDKPLKEALKYAYRFQRRDDLLQLQNLNEEFLSRLRLEALKEALLQLKLDNNRKAAYFLKYANKLNEDDYVARLAMGISQTMGRNKYEGQRNLNMAYEMIYAELDENKSINVSADASNIVGNFLMEYLSYWEEKNNDRKYLQALSMAHLLLENDAKFWTEI